MNAIEILERLVAFPSVVGTANGDIAGWIADYLESQGAKVSLLPGRRATAPISSPRSARPIAPVISSPATWMWCRPENRNGLPIRFG